MSAVTPRGDAQPLPPRLDSDYLIEVFNDYLDQAPTRRERDRRAKRFAKLTLRVVLGMGSRQIARIFRSRNDVSRDVAGLIDELRTAEAAESAEGG